MGVASFCDLFFCIAYDVLYSVRFDKVYILKLRTFIENLAWNGSYVKAA